MGFSHFLIQATIRYDDEAKIVLWRFIMTTQTIPRATIDDLYRVEGKAELIGGRIVKYMASGLLPSQCAFNTAVSLRVHSKAIQKVVICGDGLGYAIPELPSGRESFSPDASYYDGPLPTNRMRFIDGPPTLAVEVRSENDYGRAAEIDMEEKREDYFAAGTLVIWDVDPGAEPISVYRHDAPTTPVVFRRGEIADAEPAVPGWRMAVDEVFEG